MGDGRKLKKNDKGESEEEWYEPFNLKELVENMDNSGSPTIGWKRALNSISLSSLELSIFFLLAPTRKILLAKRRTAIYHWKTLSFLSKPSCNSSGTSPKMASSSTSNPHSYDVLLSFRGEDTRKNFTDHLYNSLVAYGIHTFRDDEEVEKGEDI